RVGQLLRNVLGERRGRIQKAQRGTSGQAGRLAHRTAHGKGHVSSVMSCSSSRVGPRPRSRQRCSTAAVARQLRPQAADTTRLSESSWRQHAADVPRIAFVNCFRPKARLAVRSWSRQFSTRLDRRSSLIALSLLALTTAALARYLTRQAEKGSPALRPYDF